MLYPMNTDAVMEMVNISNKFPINLPYFVTPAFSKGTFLKIVDLEIVREGDLFLLFNPRTATWCYLNKKEFPIVSNLCEKISFSDLAKKMGDSLSSANLKMILTLLFRLGLLEIDGNAGLKQEIYEKGPLFIEEYTLELLITEECSMLCPYCFAESSVEKEEMPLETGYKAIDVALTLPSSYLCLNFNGGEPLARYDKLVKLVSYIEARLRKMKIELELLVQLTTDGTLLDHRIAEFLHARKIKVNISLDGPRHINLKSRPHIGGDNFYEKVLEGIRLLKEHEIDFTVIAVVNRYNCNSAEAILEHFAKLGIESVRFNPVYPAGRANSHWDEIGISAEDYLFFMQKVVNFIVDTYAFEEANISAMLRSLVIKARVHRCMRSPCAAGYDHFVIDPKGNLYPCSIYRQNNDNMLMGNINDIPRLESAFINNEVVKEMANRIVGNIQDCRRCTWRHLCEGGCSLSAYARYGTLYKPCIQCEFYKKMYPYLLKLLARRPEMISFFVPEAVMCRF